jgi:hypothetical protein
VKGSAPVCSSSVSGRAGRCGLRQIAQGCALDHADRSTGQSDSAGLFPALEGAAAHLADGAQVWSEGLVHDGKLGAYCHVNLPK